MTAPDVQTTILDLQWYIKVKRKNMTWFLYVNMNTTSIEIKRMMTQFIPKKVHDMQLTIPRYDNRKFADELSLEKMNLVNGETLTLHIRVDPASDKYEELSEVIGNYDTVTTALYR